MKSIEEAAIHHAFDSEDLDLEFAKMSEYQKIAFKAGVEYAQRWISINEEMPETTNCANELSNIVLAKCDDYANEICAYFDGICGFWRVYPSAFKVIVTHWRPISFS